MPFNWVGQLSGQRKLPRAWPPSASYLFHSPPQEVEQLSSCFIPSGTVGIEEEMKPWVWMEDLSTDHIDGC